MWVTIGFAFIPAKDPWRETPCIACDNDPYEVLWASPWIVSGMLSPDVRYLVRKLWSRNQTGNWSEQSTPIHTCAIVSFELVGIYWNSEGMELSPGLRSNVYNRIELWVIEKLKTDIRWWRHVQCRFLGTILQAKHRWCSTKYSTGYWDGHWGSPKWIDCLHFHHCQ